MKALHFKINHIIPLLERRWYQAGSEMSCLKEKSWRKHETIFPYLRFTYWKAEATLKAYRISGTCLIQGRFHGNCSNLEGKGEQK